MQIKMTSQLSKLSFPCREPRTGVSLDSALPERTAEDTVQGISSQTERDSVGRTTRIWRLWDRLRR